MGQGGFNIAGSRSWSFRELNELATRHSTTVGTQTFTGDEVLVLPSRLDPNDLYAGYSPSGVTVGDAR